MKNKKIREITVIFMAVALVLSCVTAMVGVATLRVQAASMINDSTDSDELLSLNHTVLKGESLYNNKIKLSWNKVDCASGYEVYKNNKKVRDVRGTDYKEIKLKNKRTFKYKVRAYHKEDGIITYGDFSNTVSLKSKKRDPKLLMVDNSPSNRRVVNAFKNYAGVNVKTVYDLSKVDPLKYDGLIIPGGNNMSPDVYEQKKHASTFGTNKKKDRIQIEAVKRFAKAKKPVLGICRGNQVINVAFGGTLKQNLNLNNKKAVYHMQYHKVSNVKGYWMYSLFGKTKNTYQYHHQAVGKLGEGLVATSYSKGYKYKHIESIQHKTLPVYGIQWHPDSKIKRTKSKKVFTGFKKICLKEMSKF